VLYLLNSAKCCGLENNPEFAGIFFSEIKFLQPYKSSSAPQARNNGKIIYPDIRLNDSAIEVKSGYAYYSKIFEYRFKNTFDLETRLRKGKSDFVWSSDDRNLFGITLVLLSKNLKDKKNLEEKCKKYHVNLVFEEELVPFFQKSDKFLSNYGFKELNGLFEKYSENPFQWKKEEFQKLQEFLENQILKLERFYIEKFSDTSFNPEQLSSFFEPKQSRFEFKPVEEEDGEILPF